MKRTIAIMAAAAGLVSAAAFASAQESAAAPPARPVFKADGSVRVPAFILPPSEFSSEEAQAAQAMRARIPASAMTQDPNPDITARRKALDAMMAPRVAEISAKYPVSMTEETIAGVPVRVFTPADGEFDPHRVLINLHGGAFTVCWDSCSIIESAPIAAVGGYKVVSIDYRMAPEHRHPAGVEDVARVYTELLKSYDPGRIGIFGCSAGGALTAQTAAWLPANGLPQAGAVGIFGAGGVRLMAGDSAYIAGYIDGSFPPPPAAGSENPDTTRGYFAGVAMDDPSVSPALHPEVATKFPPTLIITGTRAMDLSPAIVTNSKLMAAGVETDMIVGEAMGHCYFYDPALPESEDAYDAIVGFFREHMR